jgi:hypothetical protein
MYSEKLLATLERIFHISTGLVVFIPSAHLSASYNNVPIVQFHDLMTLFCRNFSKPEEEAFVIFRTFSLSLMYYLIASATVPFEFIEGNRSTRALGCTFCKLLIALDWV